MRADSVVPIAETTRNDVAESLHFGAVVALGADGSTAWSAGDVNVEIYPRSALKPLQVQAMLEAGLDADAEDVAVACGSHSGEPAHLAGVRRLLAGVGLDDRALGNTPAMPLGAKAWADAVRAGLGPSALMQNCSGKHAAMIATCVVNGWDLDSYLEPDHPVQKLIDAYIGVAAGGVSHTGVDGCGAPTAMVTLIGLAVAMRALAVEEAPVHAAMTSHPALVAGDGRDDTMLMRAVPGLLVKGGAEGVHVAAHPDGRTVAFKVADGGERARLPVLVAALRSLGVDVDDVVVPPILGHGRPVGEVRSLVGEPDR